MFLRILNSFTSSKHDYRCYKLLLTYMLSIASLLIIITYPQQVETYSSSNESHCVAISFTPLETQEGRCLTNTYISFPIPPDVLIAPAVSVAFSTSLALGPYLVFFLVLMRCVHSSRDTFLPITLSWRIKNPYFNDCS